MSSYHFNSIPIKRSWLAAIGQEFTRDYMKDIQDFLCDQLKAGKTLYPSPDNLFAAFNHAELQDIKVVIIGQDPYHGPDQAHGLSFSVKKGVKIPPSLRNIYKELENDLGCKPVNHGCLDAWATQGVLLLNSVLTVEMKKAGSHKKIGWQRFTGKIIQTINDTRTGVVFILWGSDAQKKAEAIDPRRHKIIASPHPSPLSSYRGFFGSKPFSKTNQYLESTGQKPIQWQLSH